MRIVYTILCLFVFCGGGGGRAGGEGGGGRVFSSAFVSHGPVEIAIFDEVEFLYNSTWECKQNQFDKFYAFY